MAASVISVRAALPLFRRLTAIAVVLATRTPAIAQADPELKLTGLLPPGKCAVFKRP